MKPGNPTLSDRTAPRLGTPPLLVNAREAARLCGLGRTAWYALHSSGRCPLPIRLGRAVRWDRRELEAWTAAGCPARDRWHAMKGGRR